MEKGSKTRNEGQHRSEQWKDIFKRLGVKGPSTSVRVLEQMVSSERMARFSTVLNKQECYKWEGLDSFYSRILQELAEVFSEQPPWGIFGCGFLVFFCGSWNVGENLGLELKIM